MPRKSRFPKGLGLLHLVTAGFLSIMASYLLFSIFNSSISQSMRASKENTLHLTREKIFKSLSCDNTLAGSGIPPVTAPNIGDYCVSNVADVPKPPFLTMKAKDGSVINPTDPDWEYRASCILRAEATTFKKCILVQKRPKHAIAGVNPDWARLYEFPHCCDDRNQDLAGATATDPCAGDPPVANYPGQTILSEPCVNNSGAGLPSVVVSTEAQLRKVFTTGCSRKIILGSSITLTSDWDISFPELIALDGRGNSIIGLKNSGAPGGASLLGNFSTETHPTDTVHVCHLTMGNIDLKSDRRVGALFGEIRGVNKDFQVVLQGISLQSGSISEVISDAGSVVGRLEQTKVLWQGVQSALNITTKSGDNVYERIGGIAGHVHQTSQLNPQLPAFQMLAYAGDLTVQSATAATPANAIGGLVGALTRASSCASYPKMSITQSSFNGNVRVTGAGKNIGGLLGYGSFHSLTDSGSNGLVEVSGIAENVGGIAGCWLGLFSTDSGTDILNNSAVKALLGQNVGGIFGTASVADQPTVPQASNSGDVWGNTCVGGAGGKLKATGNAANKLDNTGATHGSSQVNQYKSVVGCYESFSPSTSHLSTTGTCDLTNLTCP